MARGLLYLIETGLARVAELPQGNFLDEFRNSDNFKKFLDGLEGYTLPLINKDYSAKTAIMWNSAYLELGLKYRNIMLVADPKDIKEIFEVFREDPKYLGGGAGVGFKDSSLSHLDVIDDSGIELGSINIIAKKEGKLFGYNTDAYGYVRGLERKFEKLGKHLVGTNVIVAGAGGVSKPIIIELSKKGPAKIDIVNRTKQKAVEIASEVNSKFGKDFVRGYDDEKELDTLFDFPYDLFINVSDKGGDNPKLTQYSAFASTSLDNKADENGLLHGSSQAFFNITRLKENSPNIIVSDINLPKQEPMTLRVARQYGVPYNHLQGGIPMVVFQGVPAFEHVHGRKTKSEKLEDIMAKAARLIE